jgi:hypothetical protein
MRKIELTDFGAGIFVFVLHQVQHSALRSHMSVVYLLNKNYLLAISSVVG